MLSTTLPALPRDGSFDRAEQVEAFALTYLAKYADSVPATRVTDSYRRAWGIDNLKFFPATSSAPSWLMAFYYPTGRPAKVIIAIAGVRSLGALLAMGRLGESGEPLSGKGEVFRTAKIAADAILAIVAADVDYLDATTHRRHTLTVAGYSLGAAAAEVLAAYIANADPGKTINLEKFGSPRVGNAKWQRMRPTFASIRSMYLRGDPLHLWPPPAVEFNPAGLVLPTGLTSVSWFREDDYAGFWVPNMNSIGTRTGNNFTDEVGLVANGALFAMTDTRSAWHYHPHTAYRWHWMNVAVLLENSLWGDRFLRLEHPDETNWQTEVTDRRDWADVPFSTATTPPDFVMDENTLRAIGAVAARPPVYIPDSHSDAGGGGEWGFTPVPTIVRNARRLRRRPG